MRLFSLALAAVLLPASAAWADTISATAVAPFQVGSTSDQISFDVLSPVNVPIGGTFVQNGDFVAMNNYNASVPFTFNDTFTINGITQTLNFTGTDLITFSYDLVTVNAMSNVAFGNTSVSFAQATSTAYASGVQNQLNLVGTVGTATVTPEPSSLVLLGTGLVGMFGVARRKFARA